LSITLSVTSVSATVTRMRLPGAAGSSSPSEAARKPFFSRSFCGVELYWMLPKAQWWLVTTRPCGDTKDAVHPPRLTTAPIG